jgi:hypothetical protein
MFCWRIRCAVRAGKLLLFRECVSVAAGQCGGLDILLAGLRSGSGWCNEGRELMAFSLSL